jgi:enolase-phosphatase E1
MARPAWIVTDVEGTTTPIAFVREVLFPYARAALPALLREKAGNREVAAAVAEVAALAPGRDPLAVLLGWMDEDAKVTPLKTLQGLVWRAGYESGAIRGALYPDVAPCLRDWHRDGLGLAVYSSGSEAAQRLIFGHSVAGDLVPLFSAFFDTRIGGKRAAESYRRIASELGAPAASILFLSDMEAELDAAATAGFATCQVVRAADGTTPSPRHRHAPDFPAVTRLFGLAGA